MNETRKMLLYFTAMTATMALDFVVRVYMLINQIRSSISEPIYVISLFTTFIPFYFAMKSTKQTDGTEKVRRSVVIVMAVTFISVSGLAFFVFQDSILLYATGLGLNARESEIFVLYSSFIAFQFIMLIYLSKCLLAS